MVSNRLFLLSFLIFRRQSHGCNRFKPIYLDRIEAGMQKPVTEIEILKEGPTTAVLDAHDGMGMVASYKAMKMADKEDVKCFAAVATSLNNAYPHADRSKNLYNMVIKGMKNTREPRQEVIEIDVDKVEQAGVIDIELKDIKGNVRRLTDLKGKVVLVDFTMYNSAVSSARNLALREVYDKYHDKGLEIYQVSFDPDEHFWKTSADNLPWICVRDATGAYSRYVSLYNIQNLPSVFLVDRENTLNARG